MVAYCHANEYDSLREMSDKLRWQLVDAHGQNDRPQPARSSGGEAAAAARGEPPLPPPRA
uniref:Uncharacterized protein n=1 Tax=Oryza punctata TaxID=4537 RepID=A0A0E0M1B6_ORYPU